MGDFDDTVWRHGLGNPTRGGSLAALVYLAVFVCCFWAFFATWRRRTPLDDAKEYPLFWMILAWLMLFLALGRQLNLQSWLTETGRTLARAEGWYRDRRMVQAWFVLTVCVTGLGLLGMVFWLVHGAQPRHILAFVGTTFLLGFVFVRLISLHSVDVLLSRRIGGVRVTWLLELGAVFCVMVAAWSAARPPRQVSRANSGKGT